MIYHNKRNNQTAGLLRYARNDIYAFTLAEVLITLGIIGVVAALTLGVLIPNFEKQKNLNVLKKSTSEIMNYVSDFKQSEGCVDIKSCWSRDHEFQNAFAQYLLDKKKFSEFVPFNRLTNTNLVYRAFNRKTQAGGFSYLREGMGYTNGKIDSNNGYGVPLVSPSGNYMIVIDNNYWGYLLNGQHFAARVHVLTDNKKFGYKGRTILNELESHPNDYPRAGIDLFSFYIMEDGRMLPEGTKECKGGIYYCNYWEEKQSCNPENPESTGIGCFARILEDGWQIKYKW